MGNPQILQAGSEYKIALLIDTGMYLYLYMHMYNVYLYTCTCIPVQSNDITSIPCQELCVSVSSGSAVGLWSL